MLIQIHYFCAVRLDDIISEVGVTTGSLYWHFRDRDDLIRQALAEHLRRSIEATVEGINTALDTATGRDDYLAQLTPFLANPFDPEHVDARWRRFELLVSTRRDPELRELMRDLQVRGQRAFVDVLTKAQQRGMFRDDYFLYRTAATDIDTTGFTAVERRAISEYRWWPIAELENAPEPVYPLRLAALLTALLTGPGGGEPTRLPWHHP